MDIVLIILGILGLGAIVIAAYVFTVAARNYVSSDNYHQRARPASPDNSDNFVERSPRDRRRGAPVSFPITVNSVTITRDRRTLPDRRLTASPG